MARARMARLALSDVHRQAGDRRGVTPARLSRVLDVEEPTRHRPPGCAARRSRADSRHVHRESPVGAPRIHGELLKLGISVSQSTVATYMRRHPRPPSQTWRTFLTNHASQIIAADFFVVPTITFRLLFVLVILAHDRRRIVHVAVTEHPTAAWSATASERLFGERDAAASPSRSRFGLCRRGDHHRPNEHPDGSNRAAITVAERLLRGAHHRLNPTRVPRSRDRDERGRATPGAHGIRRALPALAHASRARQGHADSDPQRPRVIRRRRSSVGENADKGTRAYSPLANNDQEDRSEHSR
jgi:hypothetical protein